MATISKVQIANMALANIGAKDTIESLDEASTEARTVKTFYDHSLLTTLEAYDWSFARKRQALSLDSDDPPDEWRFRYQYPADCVRARVLEQPTTVFQADAIPFSIEMSENGERKTILTDLENATLVYTFDQQNVLTFSRHFINTLSYALAHDIAIKLTGKLAIKQEMLVRYLENLRSASAHDANEGMDRLPRDADWIRGR